MMRALSPEFDEQLSPPFQLTDEQLLKVRNQVEQSMARVGTTGSKSVGPLGLRQFTGRSLDRTQYTPDGNLNRRVQIWEGVAKSRLSGKQRAYNLARIDHYFDDRVTIVDLDSGVCKRSFHGLDVTYQRDMNEDSIFYGGIFFPCGDAGSDMYEETGTPFDHSKYE